MMKILTGFPFEPTDGTIDPDGGGSGGGFPGPGRS